MKRLYILIAVVALVFSCANKNVEVAEYDASSMLVYSSPATNWEQESLPIGNGFIGASIFGGVNNESIVLNEKTLWEGGPGEYDKYNGGNTKDGASKIEEIRKLINENKRDEAHKLAQEFLTGNGTGYGAYQKLGSLDIKFPNLSKKAKDYKRSLDLNDGVQTVTFSHKDINYNREYFASYPNNLIAAKYISDNNNLTADFSYIGVNQTANYYNTYGDAIKKLTTSTKTGRTETITAEKIDNQTAILKVDGKINSNNMEYQAIFKIVTKGGDLNCENGKVKVLNASEIVLYFVAATDYLNSYPTYKGNDYKAQNAKNLASTNKQSYSDLYKIHNEDYKSLYSRSKIVLGEKATTKLTTDTRLANFKNDEDPKFAELFINYAKYLMISSSRKGSLPLNLQGMWCDSTNPPWSSDYHTNINLQMAYWPVEALNMGDTHKPLLEYIKSLVEPGKITAKQYYGASGWVVNTMNNPFGFTAPGWDPVWGHFPGGAAWLCQHIWRHYSFNLDKEFLAEYYPIMKEAANFWADWLILDKDGNLTSSPSYSPEHGTISSGATMDLQIATEIFTNTILASEVLKVDAEYAATLKEKIAKIKPFKVGQHGQLQEWAEDIDDPNNKHRHISHLYALFPANLINVEKMPAIANAAKVTLSHRGDEGTGWSIAWKTNFFARLRDGEKAYSLVKRLFTPTTEKTIKMNFAGGLYKNLYDAHPPFQIDGNFGATSGILEMLMQSHNSDIVLLPALPQAWNTGSFEKLKAKGAFSVSADWKDGKLTSVTIETKDKQPLTVKNGNRVYQRKMKKGEIIVLNGNLEFVSTNKIEPDGFILEMYKKKEN